MAKKPAGLIYGVDEKPPLSTLLLLGLQHVSVMSVGWIFVVVIVTELKCFRSGKGEKDKLHRFRLHW
jgi:xanthine/uracil permease